ncbi:hypothetical protein DM02DRAFT_728327 [Periconia macrospinosa]|uniref:Rhodopsin domain-containing protein n=1 Tax=Periconia macrospinosa TaxID=97972 RepID=A0A2V1DRY3_9PLEO|nr:hypothetical protein DM02DRAFT_728327 [Periconia macrospinosa]
MYSSSISQRDGVVGAAPPPPGITPNFINPPTRLHTFIVVHIVLLSISTLFLGLRFFTARFILRHIRADDFPRFGFGRHIWDIPLLVFSPNFMKIGALSGTFAGLSIMLTKLSILTLFLRFIKLRGLRITVYVIMAIVVVYSLVTSFEWIYACRPLHKYWDFTVPGSCIDWEKIAVFNGSMNSVTDIIILILPALFLRKLKLPKKQKIGVGILLMAGGFILVVSIIRLKQSLDIVHTMDITWEGVPVGIWWAVEAHIAVVCASISAGKPFLRRFMPAVIGSSFRTKTVSTKLHTMRSTDRERLSSRGTGEGPQNNIFMEDIIIELGKEPPVREEYSSDRELIIMGSRETGDGGP